MPRSARSHRRRGIRARRRRGSVETLLEADQVDASNPEGVNGFEQLAQRPPQAVESGDAQAIPGPGVVDELGQAGPVEALSRDGVGEHPDGAGLDEAGSLGIGVLVVGGDASVARRIARAVRHRRLNIDRLSDGRANPRATAAGRVIRSECEHVRKECEYSGPVIRRKSEQKSRMFASRTLDDCKRLQIRLSDGGRSRRLIPRILVLSESGSASSSRHGPTNRYAVPVRQALADFGPSPCPAAKVRPEDRPRVQASRTITRSLRQHRYSGSCPLRSRRLVVRTLTRSSPKVAT